MTLVLIIYVPTILDLSRTKASKERALKNSKRFFQVSSLNFKPKKSYFLLSIDLTDNNPWLWGHNILFLLLATSRTQRPGSDFLLIDCSNSRLSRFKVPNLKKSSIAIYQRRTGTHIPALTERMNQKSGKLQNVI